MYKAYIDLHSFEVNLHKNLDKARSYRKRIKSLVPWYMPVIDSIEAAMPEK
jgi:hypothetical protein